MLYNIWFSFFTQIFEITSHCSYCCRVFYPKVGKLLMQIAFSGRQTLGGPQWSPPLVPRPCAIPFPSVWAGPHDSVLMNRTQQQWWDVTTKIRSHKLHGFHLGLPLLLSHCCSQRRQPRCGELPSAEAHVVRTESVVRLAGQPANPPPVEPSDDSQLWLPLWLQPCEAPHQRHLDKLCIYSELRNGE